MPRNNRGWALPLKKFKDKFLYINSKDFSQISILKTKIYLYLQYLQSASALILDQSNSLNCRPWTVEHSNPVSHPLYWLPASKEYSLKPFLAYMALPLNQNFIRLQPSCYRPWRQTWATYDLDCILIWNVWMLYSVVLWHHWHRLVNNIWGNQNIR